MKNIFKIFSVIAMLTFIIACDKDDSDDNALPTYASTSAFLIANASPIQSHSVNAVTGGNFTTTQGTLVSIPPNAFLTQSGSPVTGNVVITFKDVYKKSEMLFSDLSTNMLMGGPIKSAGMFYIKAMQGAQVLVLDAGKAITVNQPFNGLPVDTAMVPLELENDSLNVGWFADPIAGGNFQLTWDLSINNYIFSLYQFNSPLSSGSWCNSDNASFFSGYPMTNLTIHPINNTSLFQTDVFLIFTGINSMVHVYSNGTNFVYNYAPQGTPCTIVAVGVKDGVLYSCFKPITIINNMTVDFGLTETDEASFKTALNALN